MSDTRRPTSGRGLLLLALTISGAFLMEQLDATILVAAIPAIAADFGVEPLRINLAVSLYLVTMGAMIPASSWMADRFGAKRVFLWAIAGFLLTSIGAALAQNLTTLIVVRVVQAISGAMMTPVGRLLLIRNVPREELANAIAWMSMPALIGPVLGPLLGGWLVTYADWPWIFLVKVPIGVVALILGLRLLPADEPQAPGAFDARGFLLCAFVLAAAQLVLDQLVHAFLPAPVTLALVVALPLAALAFLRQSRRTAKPALDLTLLRLRMFRIAFLAGGLSRMGLNAVPFLLQLQLQLGFGWTAAKAGSVVFAVAAGALVLKPMMRRVLGTLGFRRTLVWNALAGAALTAALAAMGDTTPEAVILALVTAYGVSRSLQFNAVNTLLFADIPKERQSASTALGGVGQQLSMGLGISGAAVLVAQFQATGIASDAHAIGLALGVTAGVTALSGLLFLFLDHADGAAVSGARAKSH